MATTTKKKTTSKKATRSTAKKKAKKSAAKKATTKKKKKRSGKKFSLGFRVRAWTGEKTPIVWIDDNELVSTLARVCQVHEDYTSRRFRRYVEQEDLFTKYRRIERLTNEDEDCARVLKGINEWLQALVVDRMEVFEKNRADGFVTFDDLWLMYYEGQEVVFDDNGAFVAGEIASARLYRGWSGIQFVMGLKVISHDGEKFSFKDKDCAIPFFLEGERINNLPVRPLSDSLKRSLSERGAKVLKTIKAGSSYEHYDGELLVRSVWGNKRYRADGRCMLDPKTHKKMNENYERRYASAYTDDYDSPDRSEKEKTIEEITAEECWRVSPWVSGFSFKAKQWGEFNIEHVSGIQFNTEAYDQLVLPEREVRGLDIAPKHMIRSLVEHGAIGFTDVISDKGGGIIMLLHGPPGTGKTLTAEAIADLLKRPLYSVSVGELGTTPADLEKNLHTILEVATLWNAVLLIDEADIFLEKRTPRDIERNALVAIFLRMLEYYQGVLFLTTNRVRQFDPAFNSRLSIALHYPDHGIDNRRRIWTNLMLAAKLDPKAYDLNTLAAEDVNGRQIKHAIRIGLSLAANESRKPRMDDFMKTLILAQQFNEELGDTLTDEFEPLPSSPTVVGNKKGKRTFSQKSNGRSRAKA